MPYYSIQKFYQNLPIANAQKIKTQVIDVSYNLQSRALDCPDLHDNVAEQGEQSYMQQATGFYGFSTTATTYCVASHYVLIPNPPKCE